MTVFSIFCYRVYFSVAQFAQCRQIKMNFKSCQFLKSIFFIGNRSFTCIGQNSSSETKSCRDARGGGGHLGIFWVDMCRPGLQIGTPF